MRREAVFRIHFADGRKITLAATDAKAARTEAQRHHPETLVTKVKIDRERK